MTEVPTIRLKTVVWFAMALALGVVATTIVTRAWSASAAPGDQDATFVPITPCRVVDQRETEPIGPDKSVIQQITGTNGDCTIPDEAVAVAMNVTITLPTANSHLSIYPANLTTPPNASNLNWLATSPPTPNKVDVKLSPGGAIRLYNFAGQVSVVADVVGYYTSTTLQELSDKVLALENNQPFVTDSGVPNSVSNITADTLITVVRITPPADGTVTVMATGQAAESADQALACSITENLQVTDAWKLRWKDSGSSTQPSYGQLSGVRTFAVTADDSYAFYLICENENGGASTVEDAAMVALFTANA